MEYTKGLSLAVRKIFAGDRLVWQRLIGENIELFSFRSGVLEWSGWIHKDAHGVVDFPPPSGEVAVNAG